MANNDSTSKQPKRKRDFSVRNFKIPSIFGSKSPKSSSSSLPNANPTISTAPPPLPPRPPLPSTSYATAAHAAVGSTRSFVGVSQSGSITRREEKQRSKNIGIGDPSVAHPPPSSQEAFRSSASKPELPSLLPYESELYTSNGWEPDETAEPADPGEPAETSTAEKAAPSVRPYSLFLHPQLRSTAGRVGKELQRILSSGNDVVGRAGRRGWKDCVRMR